VARRPRGARELDDIDAVFDALANESRRHILQVLHARGEMTSGQVAERFSCSWPTTTGHLRQLEAAGLVRVERAGRERRYSVDLDRLLSVTDLWLGVFRRRS
jgi:DNA-binding transcriptional ArsR family regulator